VQATILGDEQLQVGVLLKQRFNLLAQLVDFAESLAGRGLVWLGHDRSLREF